MVLDRNHGIRYLNPAAVEFFGDNAAAFQTVWAGFDPATAIGERVDLSALNLPDATVQGPVVTDVQLGTKTFSVRRHVRTDAQGGADDIVLQWADVTTARLDQGKFDAIDRARAILEFDPEGKILEANENLLTILGYRRNELIGRHHRVLVDPAYAETAEYAAFWAQLGRGELAVGQYKRIAKNGDEVWFQSNYNPIIDATGRVIRVVTYATDVTRQRLENASNEGQIKAINKAQAVIEFALDGTILSANDNFLDVMGYRRDEVVGKNHRMFVTAEYGQSAEYRQFWDKLARGEYDAGQYMRLSKQGREVWIQASYNPILDMNGTPFKVVKYATDVTAQVRASHAMEEAVAQTQAVVAAAREGDLTQRIALEGKDGNIEALCAGVNSLVDAMADVVARVKEATTAINGASQEIAQGNADLSRRTENQASSLEETASSMEELTSTVRQNSDNATQANHLAVGASDVAGKGGQVVSEVVRTMAEISTASRKIADIIGVIDGIAFQTNILALNAAVEAARAGEQGRGFAVVAAEVRNLAQRSAGAAKEIKGLISDSVDKVNSGSELVNKAGETMKEVVESVRKVTEIMAEIANASIEQASGIEQVNNAITQMDEVTQQNAALVEQAAAAAESLQDQADGLSRTVAMFHLGEEEVGAVAAAPRQRAVTPTKVSRLPLRGTARSTPVTKVKRAIGGLDDEWDEF
ncbi:PAS domain S-box protein [Nitrogeniibacter mangrovi]|uniref:PAS domain S-box protein n=2 Tax=Nitrogeniibacter mangrovi TaxID=2016596 RepID=A0A6C1B7T2_9RHOO|nr:PAS domain S-box protein [Nitrogeniibacter mangrovi]